MPDKKSTPPAGRAAATAPNPLQRMFGTYLRLERKRLNLDISTVAAALGLADTYYRLVESGRATFNQGLSFDLISLFGSRSMGSLVAQNIRFHRLALYLVGAQCVGADMAKRSASQRPDLLAMGKLAEEDANFEKFHRETSGYFSLDDSDERQREFLENTAAPAVAQFLTSEVYVRPDEKSIVESYLPADALLKLPTLNLEMVTRMVVDLSGRPFVHVPKIASAWEDRTARHIRAVSGIYENANFIVDSENLRLFNYLYLLEKSFRELRFVFCTSDSSADANSLKTEFIRRINEVLKAKGENLIEGPLAERITFVVLSADQRQKHKSEIEKLWSKLEESAAKTVFSAYWSFDVATDIVASAQSLPVGFVGSDFKKSADIWNLDLSSSYGKKEDFNKFWEKL